METIYTKKEERCLKKHQNKILKNFIINIKEKIMSNKDFAQLSLEMHEKNGGKVSIQSKVEIKCKDDLSTAYTPGVAEPC